MLKRVNLEFCINFRGNQVHACALPPRVALGGQGVRLLFAMRHCLLDAPRMCMRAVLLHI